MPIMGDPLMDNPITANNGSLQLVSTGKIVFSTKSALLHFELSPYQLCDQVEQSLKSFVNTSLLMLNSQLPQIPLLKNILHNEVSSAFDAITEFRISLNNLDSITKKRPPRLTEWVGLGLSILNSGWSAYLSTQIADLSRSSSQLTHSIGNLQKQFILQNHQIESLAKAVLDFQGSVYETTEILTSVKLVASLSKQIEHYARELNQGVHLHKLPYALFNPSDVDDAWSSLLTELGRQQLVPIFSDRPSQLYELNADYYLLNKTFHVLVNVPVKDQGQPTMSLNKPLPTLVFLKDRLFLFQDENLLASYEDQNILPNSILVSPAELVDCQKYGTLFCCPKTIFPTKLKSCAHELLTSNMFPTRDCLSKFTLLDGSKPYVVSKPQNRFDIYTPTVDTAYLNCPGKSPQQLMLHQLQTIELPDGCSVSSHDFRLVSASHLQFLPNINSDIEHTIQLAQLLSRIPEIENALEAARDPIRQLLKSEPLTLQDVIDNSTSEPPLMYILIGLGTTLGLIILLTIIFSLRKKFKKYRRPHNRESANTTNTININSSLLPNKTASSTLSSTSAQVARQIELQNVA